MLLHPLVNRLEDILDHHDQSSTLESRINTALRLLFVGFFLGAMAYIRSVFGFFPGLTNIFNFDSFVVVISFHILFSSQTYIYSC